MKYNNYIGNSKYPIKRAVIMNYQIYLANPKPEKVGWELVVWEPPESVRFYYVWWEWKWEGGEGVVKKNTNQFIST